MSSLSVSCLSAAMLLFPNTPAGSHTGNTLKGMSARLTDVKMPSVVITEDSAHAKEPDIASVLYDSIQLDKAGLSREAFQYAWKGYTRLLGWKRLRRPEVLTICDFSQSSRRKRMYIIDVEQMKLLMQTWVAHGRNSGGEFATRFSNTNDSHQSSLGFYITKSTYHGEHGYSLKIGGVEYGYNHNAEMRNIVVHGSDYVGADYLRYADYSGRSWGCPAVPDNQKNKVINTIKNGSCLFIYHPSKHYLKGSKILNG